jgi:hypothetical protein
VTSFEPTSEACGDYTATTTFTLGDGSTLTLDESGVVCGPDHSFLEGPLFTSYGNPRAFSASWEVQGATGQFAGMTGRGADTGLTAGAAFKATYRGTLEGGGQPSGLCLRLQRGCSVRGWGLTSWGPSSGGARAGAFMLTALPAQGAGVGHGFLVRGETVHRYASVSRRHHQRESTRRGGCAARGSCPARASSERLANMSSDLRK